MVNELSEYKYMIVYEVEPKSDPVGNTTHEEKTEDCFNKIFVTLKELQDEIKEMREDQSRNEMGDEDDVAKE